MHLAGIQELTFPKYALQAILKNVKRLSSEKSPKCSETIICDGKKLTFPEPHWNKMSLVGQLLMTGGPFQSTGGEFGPPVNMLDEALID